MLCLLFITNRGPTSKYPAKVELGQMPTPLQRVGSEAGRGLFCFYHKMLVFQNGDAVKPASPATGTVPPAGQAQVNFDYLARVRPSGPSLLLFSPVWCLSHLCNSKCPEANKRAMVSGHRIPAGNVTLSGRETPIRCGRRSERDPCEGIKVKFWCAFFFFLP